MNPRLLIVDGHAYAYRAFYAIRELRSPEGQPTNAIFGFIKLLAKLRASLSPSHLIVVWDGGLSAERTFAWPAYKAQRPEMPAELASQIDEIVHYLQAAGVASFCRDGVEADDYIACLARPAARAGMEVVIASADKDFMQLVTSDEGQGQKSYRKSQKSDLSFELCDLSSTGRIGLFNPNDKSEAVWTAEHVRHKAGVGPAQIVDWLALMGDSVDNIPGVPGVGPKTAAQLLNQFGSVAAMYGWPSPPFTPLTPAHLGEGGSLKGGEGHNTTGRLDEVKSERLRAALAASAADVQRNVELVRLKDDLPCEFSADELAARPPEADRLAELFGRWGFRTMLAELKTQTEKVKAQNAKRKTNFSFELGDLSSPGQPVLL